jgi:hypothetical protein
MGISLLTAPASIKILIEEVMDVILLSLDVVLGDEYFPGEGRTYV